MTMNRKSLLSFALAAVMAVALTRAQAQAQAVSPAGLADQVRAAESGFARSMAERKLDAFASYLSEEAVFFAPTEVLRGKGAVVAGWAHFFASAQAPFSWEPEQVEVLASGTLALSSGPVKDPGGNTVGTFNSIWRLEPDGHWRVVFDKGCPVCKPD
jgi:ketosteroid isomerase-like protein